MRINSYTAQSTLVQGKELERIQTKLDKTRQTVQANEREYAQYARALADTTSRWEKEWKVFCDTCQDMEEDRIEFMKDNVWAYANAVSTVCVADDEVSLVLIMWTICLRSIIVMRKDSCFIRASGSRKGNRGLYPRLYHRSSDT